MGLVDLPRQAAWRHADARTGFEVAFFAVAGEGRLVAGSTAAVEGGDAWAVQYELRLNSDWSTASARLVGRAVTDEREVVIEASAPGRWLVDGVLVPSLDGCLDVDLESSALTNAFPVRRLRLAVGEAADAPAVYVRAVDLSVERLEQRYARLDDTSGRERYSYAAPVFDFSAELEYDRDGLVHIYPGLATRVT